MLIGQQTSMTANPHCRELQIGQQVFASARNASTFACSALQSTCTGASVCGVASLATTASELAASPLVPPSPMVATVPPHAGAPSVAAVPSSSTSANAKKEPWRRIGSQLTRDVPARPARALRTLARLLLTDSRIDGSCLRGVLVRDGS